MDQIRYIETDQATVSKKKTSEAFILDRIGLKGKAALPNQKMHRTPNCGRL